MPSHGEMSIKFAQVLSITTAQPSSSNHAFPALSPLQSVMGMGSSSSATNPNTIKDDKARRLEREARKRSEQVGRLTRARESTLDYRLGIAPNMKGSASTPVSGGGREPRQHNPVSLKGWTSLVEDRIEKARSAGVFNAVKRKGQPLARTQEESNPFIAREEFLMNRIVQRNVGRD
ncbi:hypothetical protein AX17_002096 [Amanita inopinata Kibby_2008]|nr:hypothetical protein AX17_002096 [Amanita inopinata Kibby_2008]